MKKEVGMIEIVVPFLILTALFGYAVWEDYNYRRNPVRTWKIQVEKTTTYGSTITIYSTSGRRKTFKKTGYEFEELEAYVIQYLPHRKGIRTYNKIVGAVKIS